jgi:hypothetical protein
LFESFAKPPRRSLEFLNRLPDIEAQARTKTDEASRLLNVLMENLKSADDGAGGAILSPERFEEFILCDDDVYPNEG